MLGLAGAPRRALPPSDGTSLAECPLEPVRHIASRLAGFCTQRSNASYTEAELEVSSTVTVTLMLTWALRGPSDDWAAAILLIRALAT